jgi:hypothetical protein
MTGKLPSGHPPQRRLFCDNAQCARRVFTERLPGVAAWILAYCPSTSAGETIGLAEELATLVRGREPERLDP